jgi:FKBP-type peptidyl-prolyl cis-trans isomerase FkpA
MLDPRCALVLAGLLLAGGCASAASLSPEEVSFDPALGVNLAAMERTGSGLYLQDMLEGGGAEARSGHRVSVHFVGWLPDGTLFDGVAPPDPPMQFRLGDREVIRGLDEGIVGMRVGGQRRIVVPASLGYGSRAVETVPAHSTLVFIVELAGLH